MCLNCNQVPWTADTSVPSTAVTRFVYIRCMADRVRLARTQRRRRGRLRSRGTAWGTGGASTGEWGEVCLDSLTSRPHPPGACAPHSATQSRLAVPGPHRLRMPRPSQEAPPSCRPLGGCLSLGAGPEQGPAIVGDRSCLEAARVDAPKRGLCIRGQQPRGLQPGALRLGWRITARSESDSLPPVLFLGPIGLVRFPCRALTSNPGPAAAATASQNRGLMEFNESPTRQAGLDLRPQPDVWLLAPFPGGQALPRVSVPCSFAFVRLLLQQLQRPSIFLRPRPTPGPCAPLATVWVCLPTRGVCPRHLLITFHFMTFAFQLLL